MNPQGIAPGILGRCSRIRIPDGRVKEPQLEGGKVLVPGQPDRLLGFFHPLVCDEDVLLMQRGQVVDLVKGVDHLFGRQANGPAQRGLGRPVQQGIEFCLFALRQFLEQENIVTDLGRLGLGLGHIVKQITALSGNARMVATGDYGPPIEMDSKDEIGQLVVTYNEMVNGLKERDFIRDSFGRYVDPEFAKYLLKHPDSGKLGGKRREVILLMSDIRGFTALSETLSPELIIRLLNRYFSHMIKIIQAYNGIIVDFFGDDILVFFDPLSRSAENTALCCLECACRLQDEMAVFNQEIWQEGLPELAMGIGINAGQVIVGNIGSDTRAKYGVVGSAVNIISRIQATAKANEVVISDSVFHYTKDRVPVIKTFTAQLRGGGEDSVTLRVVKNSGITAGECQCSLD